MGWLQINGNGRTLIDQLFPHLGISRFSDLEISGFVDFLPSREGGSPP
jgi:hypothetical protein